MFNNFNVNRIVINTADYTIANTFYANSDDANGRILEVQLTDNGLISDSTGYSIDLGFRTSQDTTGLVHFDVVDYDQGLYSIEFPTSMMVVGDVTCELRILYFEKLAVTKSFKVSVSQAVIDESTVEATDDFSALTVALGTVNQYDGRIATLEGLADDGVYRNYDSGDLIETPYFTDADKLDGYDSSYYAKQADLDAIVANVTIDSEVITARSSNSYGTFASLDARLEATEGYFKGSLNKIFICASDSSDSDKKKANYICTGTNDQVMLQTALTAVGKSGELVLSAGTYNIDAFNTPTDGGQPFIMAVNGSDYRSVKITGSTTCTRYQNGSSFVFENSAVFNITQSCYNSLSSSTQYTGIRAGCNSGAIIPRKYLVDVSNIVFKIPDNQKKIICLDGYFFSAMSFTGIFVNAVADANNVHSAVSGMIGVRGMTGSNNGVANKWSSSFIYGCREGFAVAGEHVLGTDLAARYCNYGFTFNNFTNPYGAWTHPITLINCADECNFNMPFFGHNGEQSQTDGLGGRQSINLIDYNMEWISTYTALGGAYAMEFTPGEFVGNINYTIQTTVGGNTKNAWGTPFWASGHGFNIKTTNTAHKLKGTTAERNIFSPNLNQQYYDTDLGKMLYWNGSAWSDWGVGQLESDTDRLFVNQQKQDNLISNIIDSTKSVIPDVSVSTYERTTFLTANAKEGQMNVKASGNTLQNLVTNGNFANGTTGWGTEYSTLSVSSNILSVTASGTATDGRTYQRVNAIVGRKVYVTAKVMVTNSSCQGITLSYYTAGTAPIQKITTPTANTWYRMSALITSITSGITRLPQIAHSYADAATASGKVMQVKDVMVIDMGADSGNYLYNLTASDMDKMTEQYFDAIASTRLGTVKTTGKNLFSKAQLVQGSTINSSGTVTTDALYGLTGYEKSSPNAQYTKSNALAVCFYDIYKNFISGTASATFTTPYGTAFVRYTMLMSNVDAFQLEYGASATAYEPYIDTVQYYDSITLRSLPSGLRDYCTQDTFVQNICTPKTLVAANVTSLVTSNTNNDYVALDVAITSSPTMYARTTADTVATKIFTSVSQPRNSATLDSTTNVWRHWTDATGIIYISFPKGTYASLAAAQTALAGTVIFYQLETPVTTNILPQILKSSPKGSLQYFNYRGDVVFAGSTVVPTYVSSYKIKALTSVKKVDIATGNATAIALSTCTVGTDGAYFTSTAITSGDLIDFEYEYDSAATTSPLLDFNYNNATSTVFSQTSSVTIANTTTETTMLGSQLGSLTLNADNLAVGKSYMFRASGFMSGTNNDNVTIKIILGGVALVTNTAALPSTFTNAEFDIEFPFTIRSLGTSGTVIGNGKTTILAGTGFATATHRPLQMTATATINTTINNVFNVTYTWGVARTANTITVTNATLVAL